MFEVIVVVIGVLSSTGICDTIKVNSLSDFEFWDLSRKEFPSIFTPNDVSNDSKSASHSIDISDENGKFYQLNYSLKHPDNSEFIKLESSEHSQNVKRIGCDDDNGLTLYFGDKSTMNDYQEMISKQLNRNGKYFICGSYVLQCENINVDGSHTDVLLQEINGIIKSGKTENGHFYVKLSTQDASYFFVFERLSLSMKTNIDTHMFNSKMNKINTKHKVKKRRMGWLSDAWNDITDGIDQVVDTIEETVDDWFDGDDSPEEEENGFGDVSFSDTGENTWSFNYDQDTDQAENTFYLGDGMYLV